MTVGIVTVAVGDEYQAMLSDWARAVAELETRPDFVTIATDELPQEHIDSLDEILGEWQLVISTRGWQHHPQVLVNDAIVSTTSDWICKMDVDDLILPHALNGIDDAHDTDVFMFGIEVQGRGLIYSNVAADVILQAEHNLVFSGSPFRRWLWIDNHYRDMIYEDWTFWIGCAKQGARFTSSGRVDYIYQVHSGQITNNINEQYWTSVVRSLV